ncbi:trypsin-like peptidase [Larkinella arboricola]|uniref:Serine protease n=1 Tax=Larkinella arboricola TaxID=643671 RepID=A0A327X821_LARAB|nr:S8 family serine peptidase [Larkinella arboricola]RAK02244.1 trypsin-like peptidase [Larkinella arboricola]
MAQTNIFESAQSLLRDRAYANYAAHLNEIERVQSGIQQNRTGQLSLTDITNDTSRLSKRIAREGIRLDKALERINGVPNFQDVSIVGKILRSATSVCRIVIQNQFGVSGYGTGFLVSPNVLITNNHVLPDLETASRSQAQFNYELDADGRVLTPVTFNLRPDLFFLTSTYEERQGSPYDGRDFTLVAVETTGSEGAALDRFGYIQMDSSLGKIIEGENCVVIQHPKGDYKKVVLKDIRLITLTDNFLIYESDTLPGSSGSVVLGLGTGAVVALHHSSIPRKDAAGNWLRKDGSIVQPGDVDEQIDWIGNEGVRVSCIVEAFSNMPVADAMQPLRRQIIEAQTPSLKIMSPSPALVEAKPTPSTTPAPEKRESATPVDRLQYFEITLSSQPVLQDDWEGRASTLVEGFVDETPLIPSSFDPDIRRKRYLTLRSNRNPWELAQQLETLPHVESCEPDLETLTDIGVDAGETGPDRFESFNPGKDSGLATWQKEEETFLKNFGDSVCVQKGKKVKSPAFYHRWWNWSAVNCLDDTERLKRADWQAIRDNLAELRFVQLDTGYSTHSKVFAGYDTDKDFDFIDQDTDARDLMERKLLKFPGHGTRTASIAVGNVLQTDPNTVNGNSGLLTFGGKTLARLIPYRIAKSVILLGRGKELVDAANYAIQSQADVMFMCMGTYPKSMFAAIAREVYEQGIIWVCAAGNQVELVVAPAIYPGTIAVAATNPKDLPWKGSSNGPMVDIAAPGESVYVPITDEEGNEFMSYGDGTSYATPHVASAAMLWKAKHLHELPQKYRFPWQIVEAFRTTLKNTARKPSEWTPNMSKLYGAGILDIDALLNADLPEADTLTHAYEGVSTELPKDIGFVEAGHFVWNILRRKLRPGPTESATGLTQRGQLALDAFTTRPPVRAVESAGLSDTVGTEALLREFFKQ